MIIAVDGPAGAGKSTVAKALAEKLGLPFLDTGAMYRAITWKVMDQALAVTDAEACAALAQSTHLAFDPSGVVVDGVSREAEIRSTEVERTVSVVAAHSGVRAAIVPLQRAIAAEADGAVAEGRDTTTVVFPDADHRFFLSASAEERARRRALQRGEEGSYEEILADILRRDHLDSTRADSPLLRGPGVMVVETGGLRADEVLAVMLAAVREGS